MISKARASASSVTRLPVCLKRSATQGPNASGAITPSSICLALRQNGSFASLKIRSIMWRLLPRYTCETSGCSWNAERINFGSPGSSSTISWNSSNTSATRLPRSAPIRPGSLNSSSRVASRSCRPARASNVKEIDPSSGLTVIVGVILSPEKTARRSLALNNRDAISSWIVPARRSANFSRVGVLIRSI